MPPSRVLPLAIAVAAGFLLGAGYVYGGFVPHHPYVFLPAAVVGFLAAFAFGVRRSSDHRTLARLDSGVILAAAFAAAVPLVYAARWAKLQVEARNVRLPSGATLVALEVDPVRFDGRPDWEVRFSVRDLPPERRRALDLRAYHEQFAGRDVAFVYVIGDGDRTDGEAWDRPTDEELAYRPQYPNGYLCDFIVSRNDRPPEWPAP